MTDLTILTDEELHDMHDLATAACNAAWYAWTVARDTGATVPSPEWQTHHDAQRDLLDPLGREIYRRAHDAKLRAIAHLIRDPLDNPALTEAWRTGPGRDAL